MRLREEVDMPKQVRVATWNNKQTKAMDAHPDWPVCEVCFTPCNPATSFVVWYDKVTDCCYTPQEAKAAGIVPLETAWVGSNCWKKNPQLKPYAAPKSKGWMPKEERFIRPVTCLILGEASKFDKLVDKLRKRKGVRDPRALAAYIGRENGKIEDADEVSEAVSQADIIAYELKHQGYKDTKSVPDEVWRKFGFLGVPSPKLLKKIDKALSFKSILDTETDNGPAAGCTNYDDGRDACMDEEIARLVGCLTESAFDIKPGYYHVTSDFVISPGGGWRIRFPAGAVLRYSKNFEMDQWDAVAGKWKRRSPPIEGETTLQISQYGYDYDRKQMLTTFEKSVKSISQKEADELTKSMTGEEVMLVKDVPRFLKNLDPKDRVKITILK